jgi:hypothetical protein
LGISRVKNNRGRKGRVTEKTLFERKTVAVRPKPIKISSPYKQRIDKKHNIKFKVLLSERKQLKLRAKEQGKSLTDFCSEIVRKYLGKKDLIGEFEYPHKEGVFVNVLLEDEFFNNIEELYVEWDTSRRQATHRLIKEYLSRESDGYEIISYWGG